MFKPVVMRMAGVVAISIFFGAIALENCHARWDQSQIIGGLEIPPTDSIGNSTVRLTDGNSICTAVLIAPDLALSAAHCILPERPHWLEFVTPTLPASRRSIDAWKLPPQLDIKRFEISPRPKDLYDITLLHFNGGLPAGFQPARILQSSTLLHTGQLVTLAGFGVSDPNHPETSGQLRSVSVQITNSNYSMTEIEIDASHGGSCYGDSGGPAFITLGSTNYLFGVDNWGQGPCNQFSVYALVPAYIPWLRDAAKVLRHRSARN